MITDKALSLESPIIAEGKQWFIKEEEDGVFYEDQHTSIKLPRPNLLGAHQIQNAGIALAALNYLSAPQKALHGAISKAKWPARMQKLSTGPIVETLGHSDVWLDGGHNPAAGQALANYLSTDDKRPTILICGMLRTKDVEGYLAPLSKKAKFLAAISIPNEQNTLTADETAIIGNQLGIASKSFTSIAEGVQFVADQFPKCKVLICGSLYLAGQILIENQ